MITKYIIHLRYMLLPNISNQAVLKDVTFHLKEMKCKCKIYKT